MAFVIRPARTLQDIHDAKELFSAYASWLNVDLTFQDFEKELSLLPGKYAPPTGDILLARATDGVAVGCVALRSLDSGSHGQVKLCEMKRLYVLPRGRNLGVGRSLVHDIITLAVNLGYEEMRLDTLNHMHSALSMYERYGFEPIKSYYENPLPGATFLARKLR